MTGSQIDAYGPLYPIFTEPYYGKGFSSERTPNMNGGGVLN